jgi:hypothetical protein
MPELIACSSIAANRLWGTMYAPLALAALSALTPSAESVELAQMTIQQRVVIRVPIAPEPTRPIRLIEKKGPKCLASNNLAGAVVTSARTIDLFTRNGPRLRAELDKQCQAVDLRFGFYIRPNADGQVCASRDTIHARTGGQCDIEKFRTLVPER